MKIRMITDHLARRRCRALFNEESGLLMLMYLPGSSMVAKKFNTNNDGDYEKEEEETSFIYLRKMMVLAP